METGELGDGWYFSRAEIDKFSPSRLDGIDAKKEANLRKSYCSFIKDIGVHFKMPQVAIATAIIFCHRFYMRQSHRTNDRYTIATACLFLAGKVEETPLVLRDVTMLAYEIRHKRDPAAAERIKQKEFYEQHKQLVLTAERVLLSTLAFDFNVQHPYKYLVSAIKIFKVAQNSLAQVAWNFVNDGLITTLCLQFKPQHIAAGAIFLAAKFLKVKLPSDGERPWWEEFDVTPRQLEEVSNQMLELYEQTKSMAASTSNDISSPQGHAPNINPCNAKTASDTLLGHVNQGSALPKAVTNWSKKSTSEAIKNSATESELTSLVSSRKRGNTDIQEQTYVNTSTDLLESKFCESNYRGEERKRKKRSQLDGSSDSSAMPTRNGYSSSYRFSQMDAPFDEISTLTSADKQLQPTSKGMVPKQAKEGNDQWRNNIY
jgi:cyclin T